MKHTIRIIILIILLSVATAWESMSAGRHDRSCCSMDLPSFCLMAQETPKTVPVLTAAPERASDAPGSLYQVASVILIIWLGLALFLYRIDRRVARLERSLHAGRKDTLK